MAEYDRYFSCAKDLRIFTKLKTTKSQEKLQLMSTYDLGVFATVMREYVSLLALKTPNITLSSKQSVKRVYNQAGNLLESIVGGLSTKYITKEIARQELVVVSQMLEQVQISLKQRGNNLKQEQILSVRVQSSFKPIDISELDKYIKQAQDLSSSVDSIEQKYKGSNSEIERVFGPKPAPETPTPNPEPTGDPFASPSNYKKYMGDFTKKYHDALQKASKDVKIPANIGSNTAAGQVSFGLCRLPIWLRTQKPLNPQDLKRHGIKFSELDLNSVILYNQPVLAIVNTGSNIQNQEIFNRAKISIRENLGDFIESNAFTSKEVKRSLIFYWLMPSNNHLPPFKILQIGLPFTQELKNVEDLTHNVNVIRQDEANRLQQDLERSKEKMQAASALIAQRDDLMKQVTQAANKAKQLRAEAKSLTDLLKLSKAELDSLRQNSVQYKAKQNEIIALESRLAVANDNLINETKVRIIGLKQKLDAMQQSIKEFMRQRV